MTRFVYIASIGLVVVTAGLTLVRLSQVIEQPAVSIQASREPQLGLPVYAQFTATQSLHLDEAINVSKLGVPLFLQGNSLPLTVRLLRNGHLVHEWQTPQQEVGLVEVGLILPTPQLIDGDIEVEFDGRAIVHARKDGAPRVFTESADDAFPDGNYRIAQNQKQGDIGLTLYEAKTRGELFWDGLQEKPLQHIARLSTWLAVLILIAAIPYVLMPEAKHTSADTKRRIA